MVALLLTLFSTTAQAGGLDLLEVGGVWGTPGATNPTAIWWNPAGLAASKTGGTQFIIEGAPTFAKVYADRSNPDYGEFYPQPNSDDYPTEYDYSGRDDISFNGVVPFIGVSSDFTIPGLGIGAGLAVPIAKGGTSDQEMGPNRFALRSGNIQAIKAIGAASYQFADMISIGVSGQFVDSTYTADVDTEGYTSIYDIAQDDPAAGFLPPNWFQDGLIEDPGYTVRTKFDGLKDTAFTFGAGIHVTPIEQLALSLSYNHGVRLDHTGDMQLIAGCPGDWDPISRFGTEDAGLCNPETGQGNTFNGTASVGYNLPSRINYAVVVYPNESLRLEGMGGIVNWSQFTDYEIKTFVEPDEVDRPCRQEEPTEECEATAKEKREETAELLTQDRRWARDNNNTFWLGVDAKYNVHEMVMVGARVLYDNKAVPDEAVSMNNWDANTVTTSAMVMVSPIPQVGIALSYGHHFIATRTITNSATSVTLDPENRKEDRYFYPESNGTYGGSIDRLGIAVRGTIGNGKEPPPKW